ncbi:MAG: hypothetical protein ACKPCM_10045 [Pseudanabaena sp.]
MEEIKNDLCKYLEDIAGIKDRNLLKKCVALIKQISEDCANDEEAVFMMSRNFADRHHDFLLSIIHRIDAVRLAEYEAYEQKQETIQSWQDDQRYRNFKELYDHDLCKGEVIIYKSHIEIQAIGFHENFKSYIPKGAKYQGKGCWSLSISKASIFSGDLYFGMPILREP